MTTSPRPAHPEVLPDLIDLDELLRGVTPIGDGADLAAPGVFADDAEVDEFIASYRAERKRDIA